MTHARREMEGKVQTVLGIIDADDLGVTMSHEHLLIGMDVSFLELTGVDFKELAQEPVATKNLGWLWHNPFSNLDNLRLQDEELAIEELLIFKKEGGKTIVELTSAGLHRDPEGLARISRATGINVIMGSGYYVGEAQKAEFDEKTEDTIAEEIIAEIEDGVGSMRIRAGIIGEIGCSWPLEEREKKSLRASACAQRRTGAAVNIHPGHHGDSPLEIVQFLGKEGADLNRVIMSHIDRLIHPLDTRCELAKMGCHLEYDLFGSHIFNPIAKGYGRMRRPCDSERIDQIIELIQEGYLEKVLISQDMCMKIKLARYGGYGYAHILRNIVPHMIERGISEEQIRTIMVENPKRLLAFGPVNMSSEK